MYRYLSWGVILIMTWGFLPATSFGQTFTLQMAIDVALKNNPDLISSEKGMKSVNAGFWEAISPDDPELFVEYEGMPQGNYEFKEYEVRKFGLAQGFDFPLNTLFKGQRHSASKREAKGEYWQQRNKLIRDVKQSFYRVVLLKKQNALHEDIYHITRENLDKARIRVLAGESSPYDTLKMRVDLAEADNQVTASKKSLAVARNELSNLMGLDQLETIQVQGELFFQPITFQRDSLHNLATKHHPVLVSAQAYVDQNNANRSLAWGSLLPSIHMKYFRMHFPHSGESEAWGGELGISLPLWFFLKGQGSIRSATYSLDAARLQKLSVQRQIKLDVGRALSDLEVAERQVANYQENTLQEVEELVRIATRSYEEGEMSYLEMAEALRTMNRIKLGYYDAIFQYLSTQAELELSVGVLLVQ